jgi:DNA-binding phage protein
MSERVAFARACGGSPELSAASDVAVGPLQGTTQWGKSWRLRKRPAHCEAERITRYGPAVAKSDGLAWQPPRGERNNPRPGDRPLGEWHRALADRDAAWEPVIEARAIRQFRNMAEALVEARHENELSTRALSQRSGVALSTLTQLENGSIWGRLDTWRRLTAAVGLGLRVHDDPDVAARLRHELDDLKSVSRDIDVYIAHDTGLRPQTVANLAKTTSPSMQTLLAVAAAIEVEVVVVPVVR